MQPTRISWDRACQCVSGAIPGWAVSVHLIVLGFGSRSGTYTWSHSGFGCVCALECLGFPVIVLALTPGAIPVCDVSVHLIVLGFCFR